MENKNDLIVEGYCFGTIEDAEAARQEIKKIEYLELHMSYDNPENMLLVYMKAVEGRVFKTPIGWEYLRGLQKKLETYEEMKERLNPISLYTVFAHRVGDEIKVPSPRIKNKKPDSIKRNYAISVIFNGILILAVLAMFFIAVTSDSTNILNYERTITNKYAAWEQELSSREQVIRDKEKELRIQE